MGRGIPTCVIHEFGCEVRGAHDPDGFAQIGSLTKVLTCAAFMRLIEQGLVEGQDPIERWLLEAPRSTGITLAHLANHTSGLPRLPPGRLSRRDPYALFDGEALRGVMRQLGQITRYTPGTVEVYSNLGYMLLGAALERAAKSPYDDLVHKLVLDPLNITDMSAHPAKDQCIARNGRGLGHPRRWTMDGPVLPAGGFWATPRALGQLVTGLLVESRLGDSKACWRSSGPLLWHNGAVRGASVFAGWDRQSGAWVVVHRLGGRARTTDALALNYFRTRRRP